MSTIVVSYGADANRWAGQFCREPRWTRASGMPAASGARGVEVVRSMTRQGIVTAVENAARRAGSGGEVIYSIGHGNAATTGATAQLGVGAELTITQEILRADEAGHYGEPGGPVGEIELIGDTQAINIAFRRIGRALVAQGVARFTFLVCVLGSNPAFLRAIKACWGGTVAVAGYTHYVSTMEYTLPGDRSYPRVSLYLAYDADGHRVVSRTDDEPRCFLELPPDRHLVVV